MNRPCCSCGASAASTGTTTSTVLRAGQRLPAVAAGELVAVMGPSGSGKSTLLNLAGGLDPPTAGDVLVEGLELGEPQPRRAGAVRRRSVGYVFQNLNLIPSLTAAENVALPRELGRLSAAGARREALAALEEVGLADLAERFPGRHVRRPAAARRHRPRRRRATSADPRRRADRRSRLADRRGRPAPAARPLRRGAAGVLVTHDARHAAWADRVVFLRDGATVDETPPIDVPETLLSAERA